MNVLLVDAAAEQFILLLIQSKSEHILQNVTNDVSLPTPTSDLQKVADVI